MTTIKHWAAPEARGIDEWINRRQDIWPRRERVTRNKLMMSNTRAIASKQQQRQQTMINNDDHNGWFSVVHGLGPGPVHQRKNPRHQPVCPGDPHFGENSTTTTTTMSEQPRQSSSVNSKVITSSWLGWLLASPWLSPPGWATKVIVDKGRAGLIQHVPVPVTIVFSEIM